MNESFNSLNDFEFDALDHAQNYKKWIISHVTDAVPSAGSILEVGAGIGQLTEGLVQALPDRMVHALEPVERFASAAKELLPEVPVHQCFAEELVGRRSYDAIVSINVLEHIEDDGSELKTWERLLNPGGRVCLLVPACPEIYAPIDFFMGHHRRYRKLELQEKMEAAGFQCERLYYFNFVGYWLWFLNFKVLKQSQFSASKVKVNDHLILHLSKLFDWIGLNRFRGQSLVCVARKRQ